jgi:hypothetical protein
MTAPCNPDVSSIIRLIDEDPDHYFIRFYDDNEAGRARASAEYNNRLQSLIDRRNWSCVFYWDMEVVVIKAGESEEAKREQILHSLKDEIEVEDNEECWWWKDDYPEPEEYPFHSED